MKIYVISFRKGKVETTEYEVRETAKLYKLDKGTFDYFYLSQIEKDKIGKIYHDYFWGYYMASVTGDVKEFKKKALEYFDDVLLKDIDDKITNLQRDKVIQLGKIKELMECEV